MEPLGHPDRAAYTGVHGSYPGRTPPGKCGVLLRGRYRNSGIGRGTLQILSGNGIRWTSARLASVATCVNCRRLQGAQVIVNLGDLAENRGMEKYIVTLSAEEREQLEAIVSKGSHQSRKIINGLILLNCDASSGRARRSTQEVAAVLHVSERKIDRVKKRFVEEGYDAALVRPPSQRIYDSKIDGELEARLIALSCGEPPEGHANWSLRLLAQRAVKLE